MKRFFTALGRALKNNWPTKLAALLFAFIIWSYVMASQNPIRDITVRGVRIDYIGIEELTAKNLTADFGGYAGDDRCNAGGAPDTAVQYQSVYGNCGG